MLFRRIIFSIIVALSLIPKINAAKPAPATVQLWSHFADFVTLAKFLPTTTADVIFIASEEDNVLNIKIAQDTSALLIFLGIALHFACDRNIHDSSLNRISTALIFIGLGLGVWAYLQYVNESVHMNHAQKIYLSVQKAITNTLQETFSAEHPVTEKIRNAFNRDNHLSFYLFARFFLPFHRTLCTQKKIDPSKYAAAHIANILLQSSNIINSLTTSAAYSSSIYEAFITYCTTSPELAPQLHQQGLDYLAAHNGITRSLRKIAKTPMGFLASPLLLLIKLLHIFSSYQPTTKKHLAHFDSFLNFISAAARANNNSRLESFVNCINQPKNPHYERINKIFFSPLFFLSDNNVEKTVSLGLKMGKNLESFFEYFGKKQNLNSSYRPLLLT